MKSVSITAICFIFALSVPAVSADYDVKNDEVFDAKLLRGSVGIRYWYNWADSDLSSTSPGLYSAEGRSGHAAELTFSVEDNLSRTFMKGFVGLGSTRGGKVNNLTTVDVTADRTSVSYVTLDGGWNFPSLAGGAINLNGFVGYQYVGDRVAYQPAATQLVSDASWHVARVGLSADGQIANRIGWAFEVAGVPFGYNAVGGARASYTYGLETEGMLDLQLTPNWDIGIGARTWWLKSRYDQTRSFQGRYSRYGLLAATKYKF